MSKIISRVSGRVVVKETDQGVPGLIVSIYAITKAVDPQRMAQARAARTEREAAGLLGANRLGSTMTSRAGEFAFEYEGAPNPGVAGAAMGVVLVVTAPEDAGDEAVQLPPLYVSHDVRGGVGTMEQFLIRIPEAILRGAGLPPPKVFLDEEDDPQASISRVSATEARREELRGSVLGLAKERVARESKVLGGIRDDLIPNLREKLSTVPPRLVPSTNLLMSGESVEAKTRQVIDAGIKKANATERRVTVNLSNEQLRELGLIDGSGNLTERTDPPADLIEREIPVLSRRNEGTGETFLLRNNPLVAACRDKALPENPCAGRRAGSDLVVEEPPAGGGDGVPAERDVPGLISHLMGTVTSPEEAVSSGLPHRPSLVDIRNRVDELALTGGPADRTAYYHFHNLQIAFEHVWQEAIDEGALAAAEDAYREIVELGGIAEPVKGKGVEAVIEHFKMSYKSLQDHSEPPDKVIMAFGVAPEDWRALSAIQRDNLEHLAKLYLGEPGEVFLPPWREIDGRSGGEEARARREILSRAARLIRYAQRKVQAGSTDYARLHKLLQELEGRLKKSYAFTVYAANRQERSINFGLLITYRQKWEPLGYQVGKLVSTVPLAPKETRKFSKKQVVKRSRADETVMNNLRNQRSESTDTYRADAQIVEDATRVSHFNIHAGTKAGASIKILNSELTFTSDFTKDVTLTSHEMKQQFREAVLKSADEYKSEHNLKINTGDSADYEADESGEITNPNDELPVTYLFYELQRRFRVSEEIYRAAPVILVAQEVPNPADIDEEWLVAHDWIINRVLLDDSFRPALARLSTGLVGQEFELEERRKTLDQQRRVVESLKEEVTLYRARSDQRYAALEQIAERRAREAERQEHGGGGIFSGIPVLGDIEESLTNNVTAVGNVLEFGNNALDYLSSLGSTETPVDAARLREDVAANAAERAARQERELRERLEREISAVEAATEAYTKALSEHLNWKAQIARLAVHIKENILYYMQAVWSHEPPDQRFFRLHDVRVPRLTSAPQAYKKISPKRGAGPTFPHWTIPVEVTVAGTMKPPVEGETDTLAEVADLHNLLGYKGNYMIFPLKKPNALTDYMLLPYLDSDAVLRDPDDFGNWTLEEFTEYACCLKERLTDEEYQELKPQLDKHYEQIITSPRRSSEEVVVPSGSIYIEALPGEHPILEDFKLMHRAVDVKKVQAEVRYAELENVRAAARLIADNLEDPSIDKKIVIEGDGVGAVIPTDS